MAKKARKQKRKTREEEAPRARPYTRLLFLCVFISGAAGLIYQVLWTRALGLIFGHTAYALATVLAVFMGGLAAGSRWLGAWTERRSRPAELYGWIEMAIAGTAALSLPGLAGVRWAYVTLAGDGSSVAWLLGLRGASAVLVFFAPAFFMGGTLPVLVRALQEERAGFGQHVAGLYWVNTAGAVAGTLIAGFLLLPELGLRVTLAVAVLLNVLAGGVAIRWSRTHTAERNHRRRMVAPSDPEKQATAERTPLRRILMICFAVVGATGMAYEIGWTRLLATQLGSSSYAYTIMLATFLAGIALGSALFARWRWKVSETSFAWTQVLIATTTLVALAGFRWLPEIVASILSGQGDPFHGMLTAQLAACSVAMLPTAVIFGFNFPLVTELTADGRSDSTSVGRAYAWNTGGAIAGAVAAGFWLLPRLGGFRLLVAALVTNALLAIVLSIAGLLRRNGGGLRVSPVAGLVCSAVLLVLVKIAGRSFENPSLLTFNTMLYWNADSRGTPLPVEQKAHMMDVLYAADGLNATISVAQSDDILVLRTNGKTDASNSDINTQLMLGHVGAIAHPAPRRVLVIGFGAGMTLSALTRYPEIEELDCVEIEPAVIRAAPFLRSLNRDVLNDPRVHIIYDDGRNYLATTHKQYDVIVSEPSNPWIEGIGALFTRQFYQMVKKRLSPGGVFVQWVQSYSLYPDDLRMIFATFLSQFQNATLWHGVKSDLILMAPAPGAEEMVQRMRALWMNTALRDDFERMGMERPEGLFGFYLLNDSALRTFAAGGRVDTDDRMSLEYAAPRSLLVPGLDDENLRELYASQPELRVPGTPVDQPGQLLAASAITALNNGDAVDSGRFEAAFDHASLSSEQQIALGRSALARKDAGSAEHAFEMAFAAAPQSVTAAWGIAETNRLTGKLDLARRQFLSILARDPKNLRALGSLEQLYSDTSQPVDAAHAQRALIAAEPHPGADDYAELGEMFKRARLLDEAVAAMNECLARDPYNFQTHLNLGQILDVEKKYPEARRSLEFARRYFPDVDPQVYALLYEVDKAMGDTTAATEALRFGLEMFPNDPDLLKLPATP